MEIKTKIFKILPIWIVGLSFVLFFQIALAFLGSASLGKQPLLKENNSALPQVLGASTDIRGEIISEKLDIRKISEPDLSGISAKSFLAFDIDSGQTLVEKNSSLKLGIASLTKLMTGLVAYKNISFNDFFTVGKKDLLQVNPKLDLAVGDKVKVLDIFNSMLIGSNNDAALALSNLVATSTGKNFVDLMNKQAHELKMENSHFSNPIGFDSQYNYSTAQDLKALILETQKLAVFNSIGRYEEYEFVSELGRKYLTEATNKLIDDHPEIFAIKTGYTLRAMGAMAVKAKIDGRDIVILVLGSKDREGDTLKLAKAIENNFE